MVVKKKNVSKRRARSWRKHIDITDVDDFLEEKRLEERLGKPFEEKTNDELFVIEHKPKKRQIISVKERRKKLLHEPLKCFASLENTSKIQDPNKKRNRVKTPEQRKHPIVKLIAKTRKQNGILTQKESIALKQKLKAYDEDDKKSKEKGLKVFAKNIWEKDEEEEKVKPELKCEWFNKELVTHTMKNTSIPFVKTITHEKRSRLKAIETPHPGTSYNPTLKAHNDLIEKVIVREKEIIKNDEHLARVTSKLYKKVSAVQRDRQTMLEMSAGIGEKDSDNEENINADDESSAYKSVNAPAKNKKKEKKTRLNIKKEKEFKFAIKQAKIEKRKASDIQRIKLVKKSIEKIETHLTDQKKRAIERKEKSRYEPKTIGPAKYEDPEIDCVLPENMAGSLRTLVPEGKILLDRFKSLQRRNVLPPNKVMTIKKPAKVKRYVRNTHKELPEQPMKNKEKRKEIKFNKI